MVRGADFLAAQRYLTVSGQGTENGGEAAGSFQASDPHIVVVRSVRQCRIVVRTGRTAGAPVSDRAADHCLRLGTEQSRVVAAGRWPASIDRG
jgi:hypothetical protein